MGVNRELKVEGEREELVSGRRQGRRGRGEGGRGERGTEKGN